MKPIYQSLIIPFLLLQGSLLAHCQLPCGIYNDAARIIQIQEDFSGILDSINESCKNYNLKIKHLTDHELPSYLIVNRK